jgi:branched-chain amino acid aminotransferase
MFDAETADEIFLTSTSMCIMPVRSFNGGEVADGKIPGTVTARLISAYIKEVGCDFVQQYLDRLE